MKAKLLTMLILITGLYGGLSVNAQTQSISNPFQALESNPYLMPPTPDVAAFLNYGQYSVSQASGKVDITIPIYEIQTRELNFPITLSYIGGGIKVTDQASWAGLGWVLNAGGVVNHTVQGLPDKNWFSELPTADEIREDNDYSSLYKTIAPVNGGLNGTDKMRDRYDYSFGQGGGTFYITSYEEYLQTPYTENKIKRLLNSAKTRTVGFVITDDKGVSYHFEKPENSTVLSTSYNHSDYHTYALAEEYTYDSAWYLTKIVSMNQKDSIMFVYGTDSESYTDHKLSHSYSVKTAPGSLRVVRDICSVVNTRKVNSTPVLQKIVFEQGYIVFESTADRRDNRSYRITGVKVYNSNDDLIREVDFSHSYFGGDRLKLDNVTFRGRDGESYDSIDFDYYNPSLSITSWIPNNHGHLTVGEVNQYYSQDYMGYYNGAENRSLIGYFPQDDYNYTKFAANRNHSAEHAKVHSLKSMTYISGAKTEFIYDTENYIRPRNPGIKVKEIISTDPISNICLKKVYSYSGCKLATSFPYESQMFVDYSINVAPEVALTYVTKTYTSDPLVYGYESGWQALYGRIEEKIIDSSNPTDTMLVVRTYDISSSDFQDTSYYLDEYGRTTEAFSDWQQQLALIPLGVWPTLNSLQDGMVPEKYNVPGYFVNNGWEEGQLLKEEVYKTVSNGYKLYRSKENRYTKYLRNNRVPIGIYTKGTLFSCTHSIQPANWAYLSAPSIFNFYFFDICASTGWKKLISTTTIEYAEDTQNTTFEEYLYASINRTTNPHSYCTLYSKTCTQSGQEWRDVSFYKYVSDSNMLDQNVKDSILSRNFKSALIEEQYTRLRGTSGPTNIKNNIYTLSNNNICLQKIEKYYSGYNTAAWKQEVSVQQFDTYGRPVWIINDKGVSTLRFWEQGNIYPSAIIHNAGMVDVAGMLGNNNYNIVRTALPDASVYTYTYEDLVGLKSETGPDGTITTYDYDSCGRLRRVNHLYGGTYYPVKQYEYSYGSSIGTNYIKTIRLTDSGTYAVEYDHYNSFGTIVQKNAKDAGFGGYDVVTDYTVNGLGQLIEETKPTPVMTAGSYAEGVLNLAQSYYEDSYPIKRYEYENIFKGRLVEEHTPGQDWYNSDDKYKKYRYSHNDETPLYECLNWRMSSNDRNNDAFTLIATYPEGYLNVSESEDEDGIRILEFVNPAGQKVLERKDAESGYADTYYIYDQYGNLRIVLPPMASMLLVDADESSKQEILNDYAYIYRYDNLDRCSRRKLPGKDWEYMYYDKAGNCIFMQDGELRKEGKWKFQICDRQSRPVMSGLCQNTNMQYACAQYVYATFSSANGDAATGYVINGIQLVAPEYHTIKYYDDYSYNDLISISPYSTYLSSETLSGFEQVWTYVPITKDISVRSQLTGERVFRLDGSGETITAYYYNQLNHPVQVVSYDTAAECHNHVFANYSRGGAPIKEKRLHTKGGITYSEEKSYTYDNMGRVVSLSHSYNGRPSVTLFENHYDSIGRLSKVSYHNGCDSISYSYNVRDKLVSISSMDFNQNLYYSSGPGTPRYNDLVSSITWQNGECPVQGYMFEYNPSGNLTNSTYGEGDVLAFNRDRYSESLQSYDLNGNILQFKRWGMTGESTFGIVDDVSQQYDGNLLYSSNDLIANMSGHSEVYNRFSDNGSVECDYVYDANGNMIADANRGMSLTYNCLALPETISVSGQGTISNCYDALGAKKSLTYVNGVDTTKVEYLDGVIYKDGLPKQVLTETGYLSLEDNVYRFYIKDYLGSIRLVKNNTGAVEEINNYYPSGALFTVPVPDVQDDKYSGKELVDYADLGWYDYGARYYDPVLMRWHSADPLMEKYYDTSPYAFCSNNFVNFVDLDGRDWVVITETGRVEWRDDINSQSELPDDYLYVGDSNEDILRYLNINHSYVAQKSTVWYVTGDFGNNGNVQFAVVVVVPLPVTANMTVYADVSFNPENKTENNKYGRTFNGVQFTASLIQPALNELNPFSHKAGAGFVINYGGKAYNNIMTTPTEPYLRATGTSVLTGTVKIPAGSFAPHLSFGKATITAGVLSGGVYSKPKSIDWGIERLPSFRPIQ